MAKNGKTDRHEREAIVAGDKGTPGVGHNSLGEQGKSFVERIERLNHDIDLEKTAAKETIAGIKADVNRVLAEAVQAGIPKKVVKAVIKTRELARKADNAREDLDIADRDSLDNIRLALKDISDLPLARAAIDAAERASAS
jgi:uncharacterized protein (UPF0335 family)